MLRFKFLPEVLMDFYEDVIGFFCHEKRLQNIFVFFFTTFKKTKKLAKLAGRGKVFLTRRHQMEFPIVIKNDFSVIVSAKELTRRHCEIKKVNNNSMHFLKHIIPSVGSPILMKGAI